MKNAVKAWVDAYNGLQDTIIAQTKFTAVKSGETQNTSNGALIGDSTVRTIQNKLKQQLTELQSESGGFRILADLGITQNAKTGKLEISDTKLDKTLKDEPGKVREFFVGDNDKTGFATQTRTYMKSLLDNIDGVIKTKQDSLDSTIKRLDTQYTRISSSIEETIARYQKQFTNLDKAMSSMTGTTNQLTSMFAKL